MRIFEHLIETPTLYFQFNLTQHNDAMMYIYVDPDICFCRKMLFISDANVYREIRQLIQMRRSASVQTMQDAPSNEHDEQSIL